MRQEAFFFYIKTNIKQKNKIKTKKKHLDIVSGMLYYVPKDEGKQR